MAISARKVHTLINYGGSPYQSLGQLRDSAKRPDAPRRAGMKADVNAKRRKIVYGSRR